MTHLLHLTGWVLFLIMCLVMLSEVVVAVYAVIRGERDAYLQLRR